jgi:hypothetical protein
MDIEGDPVDPTDTPGDLPEPPGARAPRPGAPRRESRGYDIDEPPPEPSPRKVDEVCPNCGRPRPDRTEMLCLECGYNMRTLRVERTHAGKPQEIDDEEPEGEPEPVFLSRPGRGNLILPGAAAAAAGAILLFGVLFGVEGLFPDHPRVSDGAVDPITFVERMEGLGRALVLALVWFGCGVGGLVALAGLNSARLGDVRLLAVRMAAVVLVTRLWSLLDAGWLVETPPQVATWVGLALFLFNLKPRDAVLQGLLTLATFLVLWGLSAGVAWSM